MSHVEQLAGEPLRPLRRSDYDRLVDAGVFDGEHVELLWGMIVAMSPQGAPHAWVVDILAQHFVLGLAGRARVRVRMPFAATGDSEPEPDLAIVPPSDEWRVRHPDQAWLVIEVSRTSQRLDRKKVAIYAASRVDEVWLVDIPGAVVEVYRDPSGDRFRRMTTLGRGEALQPRAFPDLSITVGSILP